MSKTEIKYPDFTDAQVGDKVTYIAEGRLYHGHIRNIDWSHEFALGVDFLGSGASEQLFTINGRAYSKDESPSLYYGHLSPSDFQPQSEGAYKRSEEEYEKIKPETEIAAYKAREAELWELIRVDNTWSPDYEKGWNAAIEAAIEKTGCKCRLPENEM